MNYAERATRYAEEVVSGTIPACRFVRLACQRHLDDLASDAYEFDAEAVRRVCQFMELLPHTKGKWAGDKIKLEPWQIFLVGVPFGWVHKDTGKRRYRRAYCEVPRKNAKSTISAGLGLYMLGLDKEAGAEVYCGAGSEKQAWEVFRPAKLMAQKLPKLTTTLGLEVNAKTLVIPSSASRFEPVIGKPGDGASPSMAIVDEYHEHNTEDQYDTFMTGMGAREHPMLWVITTAGADTSGPCYALRHEAIEVLEGKVKNPELFSIIYTIDSDDDWTSEDALVKANPNIGVSVDREFLLAQQRDAINVPRKQSAFKTKHMNVWVGSADPFFNTEKWRRLSGDYSLDEFHGKRCWIGVDLAAKVDMTAVVYLFADGDDFYVIPQFYCPEEVVHDPKRRSYFGWMTEGHLIATDGNVTDFGVVQEDLIAATKKFLVQHIAFDQWNSMQMSTAIGAQTGVECVDLPMTVKHLSDPMKWVQALIEDGRLHNDGNPVMEWMMGNVTAKPDRNDNVFPRKERPENKIDGAVALIMAMERGFQPESEKSYLETGDVVWLG
jgi:phage terminase large subunit-like protein